MKQLMLFTLAGALLSCAFESAKGQEYKTQVSKEFTTTASSVLCVYNIEGFIKVEGYDGNKVLMNVDETISAKNNEELEKGKNEFKLAFDQKGDTIMAYVAAPYDSRPHDHGYNMNKEIQYRYRLEFTIKVPYGVNLHVSTINNGDITVKDMRGELQVNNVNGAIDIEHAKGNTQAHTVNGHVHVSYAANPPGQCSYHTINGEIKVEYLQDLSADLAFKTMNGEVYTDFDVERLPAKVTRNTENRGAATIYKLNAVNEVRIGSGRNSANFETLNGNIYVKKQS